MQISCHTIISKKRQNFPVLENNGCYTVAVVVDRLIRGQGAPWVVRKAVDSLSVTNTISFNTLESELTVSSKSTFRSDTQVSKLNEVMQYCVLFAQLLTGSFSNRSVLFRLQTARNPKSDCTLMMVATYTPKFIDQAQGSSEPCFRCKATN